MSSSQHGGHDEHHSKLRKWPKDRGTNTAKKSENGIDVIVMSKNFLVSILNVY